MLRFAVQPSQQARVGDPLYPPVTARLRSEHGMYNELSHMWAVATLVNYHTGDILYDQLSGRVADSAHPLPDRTHAGSSSSSSSSARDRAYFYFPDLSISAPGRYRIRVSLMQMDYSSDEAPEGMVVVREYEDSRSIVVDEAPTQSQRPSTNERAFLRILKNDGQDIPSPPSS